MTETEIIPILEVAVAWNRNVQPREWEKHQKYQPLAADIASQFNGAKPVRVVLLVVGTLGIICNLGKTSTKTGWFESEKEVGETMWPDPERNTMQSSTDCEGTPGGEQYQLNHFRHTDYSTCSS